MSNVIGTILYFYFIVMIFLVLFKDSKYGVLYFLPLIPLTRYFLATHNYPMGKDIWDIMLIVIILGWFLHNKEFVKTAINRPLYFLICFTFFELIYGFIIFGKDFNTAIDDIQMWRNYMILPIIFFIVVNHIKNLHEIKRLVFLMSFKVEI